jgi:hypothetical protein
MDDSLSTKRVNLVWTSRGLSEANWLRYLLGPLIGREVVAEKFEFVEPDTVYVISENKNLHQSFPASFLMAITNLQGNGLIHVGDEYFAGGYDVYKNFEFVLRTHHTAWFNNVPEVLTFPLGWGDGMPQRSAFKSVVNRRYVWSFLGNQKAASRPEMLRALRQIEPQFVHAYTTGAVGAQKMPPSEYHALLDDTVFAPCPMGNAMLETWRFYESLEAGCIPLIEARPWMHYHERLLGPHPIPAVYSWSQAASLIKTLSKDPVQLEALQQRIANWWMQYKQSKRSAINRFISEKIGTREGKLSTRRIPSTSPMWPVRRTIELLRHQSVMSLFRRVKRPFVKLASRRF